MTAINTYQAPFKGRSLLNWIDWTKEDILTILDMAFAVKAEAKRGEVHDRFRGKSIALIFEKRSTRTRASFETGFAEDGGHPVFLSTQDIQLGSKESVKDTARVLGRMFSAIEFRGYKQQSVEELAKFSGVPVINGLTDSFHPTQVLADVMTLAESFDSLAGLKLVFCGDARNNVARSLIVICAKLGIDLAFYCPKELNPDAEILSIGAKLREKTLAKLEISDSIEVVEGARAIYTDVWVSMGEEDKKDAKVKALQGFQVNKNLMAATGRRDTIFLHCLPAVKGQEVTEDVFESTQSRVFNQAENRKHTIKAIMLALI